MHAQHNFLKTVCWITSEPGWSDGVIYVIANLTVSNDEAADIVFAPSASDTIQVWIPPQEGANPYETPDYDLSGLATYKVSPAGNTYGPGDSVSWQVAFDVSGALRDVSKRTFCQARGE